MLAIKSEVREKGEKPEAIRGRGLMPAVFYGAKVKTTPISVSQKEFRKIWNEAGESSIITLETPTGRASTLIHDVQFDPVKNDPIHADFYVIEEGKEVEVDVPIKFEGTPPAVKELGATLVKVLHELSIKAMPKDLPHEIIVDVSSLATLESQILVSNLVLPNGVTVLTHGDEVVASIAAAREEEKEEAAPIDLSSIEVEKKGKKEEEGAEAESAVASTPEEKK